MKIDTKNLISITEANQNFSKVVKNVEENGQVIVLKNNKPQYVVSKFENDKITSEINMLTILLKWYYQSIVMLLRSLLND